YVIGNPCVKQYYGYNSFVCACNATYCDEIQTFDDADLQDGSYVRYESNIQDKRLFLTKENFVNLSDINIFDQ
ncbi:hypothetical protein L9F63_012785, partial [Diploptera punctata]